jgi:hypothetical protein
VQRIPFVIFAAIVGSMTVVNIVAVTGCDGAGADDVVWHDKVAPLIAAKCSSCHQPGGIGGFSLVDYKDVVAHKDAIAFAVSTRQMPPWTLDNTGDCQTFRDARWLSDDEIALVTDWVAEGAHEGVPAEAKSATPEHLDDGNGVVTLSMAEPYTPTPSAEHPTDDYRCFFVDPGLVDDFYVAGFEIVPGQPAEVHHMLLFSLLSDDAVAAGEQMDAADDGPGWTCFGAAGSEIDSSDISLVAGWAPGTNLVRYPENTGLYVPGDRKLVMQIHYNLLAGATPDTTSVRLLHTASVAREAAMLPVADDGFHLQPGDANARYSFSQPLVGLLEPLAVHGIFPHMHTLGQTLHVAARSVGDSDGSDAVCMGDVQHWDFHWQQLAFYDTPVVVDGGQQIDVTCTWDTTGRTDEITWGEGTQDEMCLVFAYITRVSDGPLADAFPNQ